MAVEMMQDQAEGLRRLMAQNAVRIVTVTSGRSDVGKTTSVVSLAVALGRRGRSVLILDEGRRGRSVAESLGLEPRYDLASVMRRESSLDEIIVRGPEGVGVIPAGQGLRELAKLDADGREWLARSVECLAQPVDVVLVDAASGQENSALSLSLAAQEVVVVVSGHPGSITDAYALIKVLNHDYGKELFRILVTRASEVEAQSIFGNMAEAAKRFLGASLDFLGCVPEDERVRQSGRSRRAVVDAFPSAPASAAYRQLADRLEQWPHPTGDSGRLEIFLQRLIQTSRMARDGFGATA